MDDPLLPISVQICTLNSGEYVKTCLETVIKNSPQEIIVIDGGSHDDSVEIARSFGAKIIKSEKGLARQRQKGIMSTNLPYIAIVDADDRLTPDCLPTLLKELKENGFTAIQANVQSSENTTYWQKAWGQYCSLNINKAGRTTMVGRPAIYVTEVIQKVGFDDFFLYGCEDTDLAYRFEKMGYPQGIGTGVTYRIHPTTLPICIDKWLRYGKDYARFVYKHPEKTLSIIWHITWNIPFKRMFNSIVSGNAIYAPFYSLYGLFCTIGFIREYLIIKIKGISRPQ
jgi:glycosyltransferase involved in cell wall biosynthesis